MQARFLLFPVLAAVFIMLPAHSASSSTADDSDSKIAQASEADENKPGARETRRSDRRGAARGDWWEDDDLAESLELTSDQQTTIAGLHERLQEARQAERQLNSQRRQRIPEALGAGDRDGLEEVLDEAAEVRDALHQAESDWLTGLMDALDSDQLNTLVSEHPRALTGQSGPGRR